MNVDIIVTYKGLKVYEGDWHEAPGPVREYISSAAELHGDKLEHYLKTKPEPMTLLYEGYSYKVKE